MAIIEKAKLLEKINGMIGENPNEEQLQFLEDVDDTISDYESKADGSWKEKYSTLEKKYRERFFKGGEETKPTSNTEPEPDDESTPDEDWKTNPENEFDMFYRKEEE